MLLSDKLLDELWEEAEELMDRGITGTGQGFEGPSAGREARTPSYQPTTHRCTRWQMLFARYGSQAAALFQYGAGQPTSSLSLVCVWVSVTPTA